MNKERFKNPWFWVGIGGVILTATGMEPSMFTSWDALSGAVLDVLPNPFLLGTAALAVLGVFVEPTTKGLTDGKGEEKMKIAIDDGHGMETAGKRTPAFSDGSVMRENEFNRAVVAYLHDELIRNGFSVVLTAPEDTENLLHACREPTTYMPDDFVSVHANAFGSGWNDANGVESFVYALNDAKTTGLAICIQHELIQATGLRDRGVKGKSDRKWRRGKRPCRLCSVSVAL